MFRFPKFSRMTLAAAMAVLTAQTAAAATPEQQCQAGKSKAAARYVACLARAEAKFVVDGDDSARTSAINFTCPSQLQKRFDRLEEIAVRKGSQCPTEDAAHGTLNLAGVMQTGRKFSDGVRARVGGMRFETRWFGTVYDHATGLTWEIKTEDYGIHHVHDVYSWGTSGGLWPANGTAVTQFLATLNGGGGIASCFSQVCDWRLPTLEELSSILQESCSTSPCIDALFGPNGAQPYWTSEKHANIDHTKPLNLNVFTNDVGSALPTTQLHVRAVRGPDQ